jgi:Cu/Ag efflux protein CusF
MDGMDMHSNNAQATHQGTGKVISVDKAKLTVKLVHEAIKSLGWPRMTMNFKVAESSILAELKAGDVVTFELGMEANTDKWQINRITPLKK